MSSITTSKAATGYKTESLLTNIVKTQTANYVKKEAIKFASAKGTSTINQKLGQAGLTAGLSTSAINLAVQGARSASDKLNGALGGKLSSVLGSGVGGAVAGIASKQITNLATGAVSKVSSMVQNKLGSAMAGVLGSSVGGMLGSALSMLSDGGAKNLAGARLAAGFLETGPQDESLVTDVYGISDNGILNSLTDKITGFAQDQFNDIRRSPTLVTDLCGMALTGAQNWAVSKEGLAGRVASCLGGQTGMLRGLSETLKTSITNATGMPPSIYSTAVAVIGANSSKFDAGKIDSAREVFSLINQITRSDAMKGFFDVGAESALIAGVMREAIALGVPDAIDVLVEHARHDEIAYNALYANMLVAVEHSDLDSINLMIQKVGVNAFLAEIPDAVPRLLSSYELPVGTNSENYDNEWAGLQAVLNSLSPGWGSVNRNGTSVNDLTFYSTVSADARKLLLRDDTHLVSTLIGESYSQRPDLISELKTMYPLLPLAAAA